MLYEAASAAAADHWGCDSWYGSPGAVMSAAAAAVHSRCPSLCTVRALALPAGRLHALPAAKEKECMRQGSLS